MPATNFAHGPSNQRRNLQLNSPPSHSPTHQGFNGHSQGRPPMNYGPNLKGGPLRGPVGNGMNLTNQHGAMVGPGKPMPSSNVQIQGMNTGVARGPMPTPNPIARGGIASSPSRYGAMSMPTYSVGNDNYTQLYQWDGDDPVDMEPSFEDGGYMFPNETDIRPDVPRPEVPKPQERTFRPQDGQGFYSSGVGPSGGMSGNYSYNGHNDSSVVHPSISQHYPQTREPPSSPLNLKNYDDFLEQLQQKIKEMGFKDGNAKFLIELGKMRGQLEKLQQQIIAKDEELQIIEMDRNNAYRFIEELRSSDERNRESIVVMEGELSKMGVEKGSLDQGLEKLRKERESLVQYAKETAEEKAKIFSSFTEVKSQHDTLTNQYNSLQEEYKKVLSNIESLTKSNNKLQEEIENLNEVKSTLMKRLEETEEKLEEKNRDYEELSSVQEELLEVIQQSKKEAENLQSKTYSATGELGQLRQESERKELLITTLQKELDHVREQGKQQREQLQATLEKMDHDHALQTEALNRQKSDLDSSLQVLKEKLQKSENEVSNLNRYITELKQSADLAGVLNGEMERLETEKQSLLHVISERENTIAELETQVANITNEKTNLLSRIEKQNKELEEHNLKINNIQDELTKTQTALQHSQRELEDQKNERTVERKVLHEEIHDLRNERDNLHNLEEEARKSKLIMEEKLKDVEKTLAIERKEFSETKSYLETTVKDLTTKSDGLTKENDQLFQELTTFKSQVEYNTLHIAEVSDIKTELEKQVREQQITIENLSSDLIQTRSEKEKREQETEFYRQQYDEIKERAMQEKTQNQLEVKSLCAMIKALKNNIAEKQKKVDELQMSVQNDRAVANKDRDLRERALGDKEKLEEEINSCHEVIKTLRQTNEKLEDQHHQDQQRVRQATSQLEKTQSDRELEKRVLGAEIGHLRSVNKNLEKKLVELMKNSLHNTSSSSIGSTTPMSTTPNRRM